MLLFEDFLELRSSEQGVPFPKKDHHTAALYTHAMVIKLPRNQPPNGPYFWIH